MPRTPSTPIASPLPPVWDELSRLGYGFRLFGSISFWLAVDPRSSPGRLKALTSDPAMQVVQTRMADMSLPDIGRLRVVAEINATQAEAAHRRTLISNISAPVGLIVGLSQLAPDFWANVIASVFQDSLVLFYAVLAAAILLTTGYSYVQARFARDMADVIALVLATREAAGEVPSSSAHETVR